MVSLCICFPGGTRVVTKQGSKRMDELLQGDEVLTFGKSSQCQKWTEFYTWAHIERDLAAEFMVLKVSGGQELTISRDHLLFTAGDKDRRKRVAKIAKEVSTGDKLFHLNETTGVMEVLEIEEISVQKYTGVYSPFTTSGTFLANGFLVACYANVSNFELAHTALSPLRAWSKLRQPKMEKDGIHEYALKLMKIRDFFEATLFKNRIN